MRHYIELMRLNKPIGIWLVFFPAAWAIAFAGDAQVRLTNHGTMATLILTMLVGAILMRSVGCIINDLTDRKLDAKVERTKNRPLASGAIKPWKAVLLLIVLLLLAFITACTMPPEWFKLALITLPLIVLYPWMKRLTWWPQLFLGITFNLGALFGWIATEWPLGTASFTLYFACICWTLGYDTIYAVQDMEDDAAIGIRSTARRIGTAHLRWFVAVCYGVMVALLALTGFLLGAPFPFYIGLTATAAQLLWQVRQLPLVRRSPKGEEGWAPERAGAIFRSNQWAGLLLLLGLLASRLL